MAHQLATVAWRDPHGYIQDFHAGRGYTADLIGFCSGDEPANTAHAGARLRRAYLDP